LEYERIKQYFQDQPDLAYFERLENTEGAVYHGQGKLVDEAYLKQMTNSQKTDSQPERQEN